MKSTEKRQSEINEETYKTDVIKNPKDIKMKPEATRQYVPHDRALLTSSSFERACVFMFIRHRPVHVLVYTYTHLSLISPYERARAHTSDFFSSLTSSNQRAPMRACTRIHSSPTRLSVCAHPHSVVTYQLSVVTYQLSGSRGHTIINLPLAG